MSVQLILHPPNLAQGVLHSSAEISVKRRRELLVGDGEEKRI